MKILILDDSVSKIQNIFRVLMEVNGINNEDIHYCSDVMTAKSFLKSDKFDLLILDLNMPEKMTSDANEMSGFDLVEEMIQTNKFKTPNYVCVLTEFDNLKESYVCKKLDYIFPVTKYSSTSREWEERLKSKVKYILKVESEKRCSQNNFDVAVITAVAIETQAVKREFGTWTPFNIPNDPTIYYKTILRHNEKEISIVSAEQSNMGMVEASILSTKIIMNFHPQYLIMPGIAAGIRKNHYGDIMFPNAVYDYSSGKFSSNEDDKIEFEPDPKFCTLSQDIIEKSKQNFSEILDKIKGNFTGEKPSDSLSLIADGPLACGSAVIANKLVVDGMVKTHVRKVIGLDMESYGVFRACEILDSNCKPICIKSICDFADKGKNDQYQSYAAYTSAAFTKYFIENQLGLFFNFS